MAKEKKTSKQKLDELLGINDNSSIDEFLDNLNANQDEIETELSNLSDDVKNKVQSIDNEYAQIKENKSENNLLSLQSIDNSLGEIEELIGYSKNIFKHIYTNIVSSNLIDSELIGSAAKLLESIHLNLTEFLLLYKEKQQFVNKVKLMFFQQEQKKELLKMKHEMEMEKLESKNKDAVNVENMATYSQEDIIKMLSESNDSDSIIDSSNI